MKFFAFLAIFIIVLFAHIMLLHKKIDKTDTKLKTNKKISYHISLSRVNIKKDIKQPIQKPLIQEESKEILPLQTFHKPKIKKQKKHHKKKRTIKKKKYIKQHKTDIKNRKALTKKTIHKKLKENLTQEIPSPTIQQQTTISQDIVPTQKETQTLKKKYLNDIRDKIYQNLYYPYIAKRLHIEGVVLVFFKILSDGSIVDIKILNHANKLLSKGALKTLSNISLNPIPKELHEDFLDINIPIEFKLIE